jgi:hypothetical protein
MRTSCEIRTPHLVPNCCSQCKLPYEMRTPLKILRTLLACPKGVLISQVSLYCNIFRHLVVSHGRLSLSNVAYEFDGLKCVQLTVCITSMKSFEMIRLELSGKDTIVERWAIVAWNTTDTYICNIKIHPLNVKLSKWNVHTHTDTHTHPHHTHPHRHRHRHTHCSHWLSLWQFKNTCTFKSL